jgi:hypothetical protein
VYADTWATRQDGPDSEEYPDPVRDRARTTKDVNQIAAAVLEAATDETGKYRKDPDAVGAGREGGRKGGAARAAKLTSEERSASARKAADARWHRSADAP